MLSYLLKIKIKQGGKVPWFQVAESSSTTTLDNDCQFTCEQVQLQSHAKT